MKTNNGKDDSVRYIFFLIKKKKRLYSLQPVLKSAHGHSPGVSLRHIQTKKGKKKMPAVIFFEGEWEQYHRGVIHASRLIMI